MFTELHESDSSGGALLITSKGLGLHRIFLSVLKLYSDPALLVFVLNASKARCLLVYSVDEIFDYMANIRINVDEKTSF